MKIWPTAEHLQKKLLTESNWIVCVCVCLFVCVCVCMCVCVTCSKQSARFGGFLWHLETEWNDNLWLLSAEIQLIRKLNIKSKNYRPCKRHFLWDRCGRYMYKLLKPVTEIY